MRCDAMRPEREPKIDARRGNDNKARRSIAKRFVVGEVGRWWWPVWFVDCGGDLHAVEGDDEEEEGPGAEKGTKDEARPGGPVAGGG